MSPRWGQGKGQGGRGSRTGTQESPPSQGARGASAEGGTLSCILQAKLARAREKARPTWGAGGQWCAGQRAQPAGLRRGGGARRQQDGQPASRSGEGQRPRRPLGPMVPRLLTVACPSGDLHGRVRVRGAHPRAGLQHVRVPAVPHGARRPRGPAPAQRRETVVRVGERQGPAPQGLQDAPHAEVLPVPAPRAGPQGPRDGAAAPGRRWAPRPCAQATGQGSAAPAAAAEAALSRPGQRSGSASALRRRPSGRRGPASARVSRPS